MGIEEHRKIYVLDTNVLIHDPNALQRFDEHDVVLPIIVLEEMDKVKRGQDELARNVRDASRQLDQLSADTEDLAQGCPLPGGGRLFFQVNEADLKTLPTGMMQASADNQIIAVTKALQNENPDRHVILVSKDINLRIKARALDLVSEDYRSDRVVDDLDVLSVGYQALSESEWTAMGDGMQVTEGGLGHSYSVRWPETKEIPALNSFVILPGGKEQALRCMKVEEGRRVFLHEPYSYRSERHAVWSVVARNLEQNMAMNLLMDPNLDLVSIMGLAGSGKTLLALACGLQQTLEAGIYERILVTRATVPMGGQDIGFLPGTEKEKLEPWMGAITDNLSLLLGDDARDLSSALGQHRIEIAALSYSRGRTFTNTWLIVDEAQNLTPHQMKTLITRMGEGSKMIILGNNGQIDTPYLTAHTNGMTLAIERFTNWPFSGHVVLENSERSRLAAYATQVL
ncbi:MAG: PhoH family protein [Zetaproteobacteria bacterium]|nr:PhoH family protein [Zetaproteobacteria bacterium]